MYVLIIIIFGYSAGVATTTQEFSSLEACNFAYQSLKKTENDSGSNVRQVTAVCVPK